MIVKNKLLVESHNDQYFIQDLIKLMSIEGTVVAIGSFDFEHCSVDNKKLTAKISGILTDAAQNNTRKIGILLDLDNEKPKDRISLVNQCIVDAFALNEFDIPQKLLTSVSQFEIFTFNDVEVQIACFFTNVDGNGELETVLKAIKTQKSDFADCLYEGWKTCFEAKGKQFCKKGEQGDISDKELLKLWVDFYKRFDTLKKNERDEKASKWENIMLGENARGGEIFNLQHEKLHDLRAFLSLFKVIEM